ncbi:MAG: hypothetical protein JWR54_1389 [Mucilaginibacter sp.]|nr:hypothetical protein [Mucilaginibacter sp.]
MAKAFISYSHADEKIKDKLHIHLATLRREGKIEAWLDQEILVGANLDQTISSALSSSELFIAIVSPDYLNSNYCYDKEFQKALELQTTGKITIVPIIAEHCDWLNSPFRDMKALPKDGKPISDWTNDNAAYLNIISELRRLLDGTKIQIKKAPIGGSENLPSQNYKVKRDFTQVDIVNFRRESFNAIKKYFVESIDEINTVDDIQSMLLSEDKDSFSCLISNRAKINSNGYITIFMPSESIFGRADISYTLAERRQQNSVQLDNIFTIENDQYQLYWSAKNIYGSSEKKSWTVKEIAEKLWTAFIEQVGISFNS